MKVYTIKDIASMAGVSVTTVSRVLNHRPDVNSATREKVEQIIRECHFVGNTNARGLKQGNEVIGVVIRGRSNPFLSALSEAILERADNIPDNFVTEYIDEKGLIAFCSTPRTRAEIIEYLAISSGQYALRRYLDPLVRAGAIVMTMPDKPRSPNQQYVAATE